jgi:predicted ATPase/DNA-binding CsgD family transcriptional regulator
MSGLTTPLTSFIGREHEVAQVVDLLASARLVTLTGPGGVGKTRLALAVAERASEHRQAAMFVSLAAITDVALVAPTIAGAFGLRDAERPVREGLVELLAARRVLLVLDNFEQVLPAADLVADLLSACSLLTILTTSRAVLHVTGEHVYRLRPLELPNVTQLPPLERLGAVAAVRLFVERAQAANADFVLTNERAAAVAAICARMDGLPLAIELAAARTRVLAPQALLAKLDDQLRVLIGGPRDAPIRQRTVRDTIAWSYALLPGAAQQLFRQLAVFAGGWTLEAAEAVCEMAGDTDVLDGLATVVDHSLVRRLEPVDGSTRFDMLETVREYGVELLTASGEDDLVRQRHAAYYFTIAEVNDGWKAEVTDPTMLRRLDAEHNNLRAALTWSLEHDPDMALCLAGALWDFWWTRGHLSEALHWLTAALAAAPSAPPARRALALMGAGTIAVDRGDKAATQLLTDSLALHQDLGDRANAAWVLRYLGWDALRQGDLASVTTLNMESLAISRDIESPPLIALALGNLGYVALLQGDLEQAAALVEEAVTLLRSLGDNGGLADKLTRLGWIVLGQGHDRQAREAFAESLALAQEVGAPGVIALGIEGLAAVASAQGQPARASQLFGAAHAVQAAIGDLFNPCEDNPVCRHHLSAARGRLGEVLWEAELAVGRAMPLADAIVYALDAAPSAVGLAPEPPRPAPHGLSKRELDVLRLLVDGHSNQEIATALFISPHTVIRHVANIMSKLELDSRTAVASWAIRNGLA